MEALRYRGGAGLYRPRHCSVSSLPLIPACRNNEGSDETGIIVAGRAEDGHCYILADYSLKASPDQWAREVVRAYHRWHADRVIAEVNNGGMLVETTLRMVDPNVSLQSRPRQPWENCQSGTNCRAV